MRAVDHQQSGTYSYISAERRAPKDHPLRNLRVMVDAALKDSSWHLNAVYASSGRPSIALERLLRARASLRPLHDQQLMLDCKRFSHYRTNTRRDAQAARGSPASGRARGTAAASFRAEL